MPQEVVITWYPTLCLGNMRVYTAVYMMRENTTFCGLFTYLLNEN